MPAALTNKAWTQIRHDYEHSDRTVAEICAEHGISDGTLQNYMRRGGWTRRRPLVRREPPLHSPAWQIPAPGIDTPTIDAPAIGAIDAAPPLDNAALGPRLERAIARVVTAIETTAAVLGTGHPREMERAARALAALTRTMSELDGLRARLKAPAAAPVNDDPVPEDIDEFRAELARRIRAFVEDRTGEPCPQRPQASCRD